MGGLGLGRGSEREECDGGVGLLLLLGGGRLSPEGPGVGVGTVVSPSLSLP